MTTYNNIIEVLKDNRQLVINKYNESGKAISLKDYMNEVIRFFESHTGKARKCIKGSCDTSLYICEACTEANKKANNTRAWQQICRLAHEERLSQMNCRGWYQKNFQ